MVARRGLGMIGNPSRGSTEDLETETEVRGIILPKERARSGRPMREGVVPRRRRPRSALAIAVGVVLGLGSRKFARTLPWFFATYAGDTLWASAAFLGIGLLRPSLSTRDAAILALLFSLAIELSQLYHAPWIDAVRATTLGGLVLGFGFLWSDLACYAGGVALGVMLDGWLFDGRSIPDPHPGNSSP
jgi:hypothetical protein